MLSFNLSDDRTRELRDLSQKASQKAEILKTITQEEKDYIHRSVCISIVGASTRIENAVLTDAEISWIDTALTKDAKTTAYLDQREFIQNKLSKDKERSIDEVAGCRAMLQLIYSQGKDFVPLTETTIRALHNELLLYYAPAQHYRGKYKNSSNSVVRRDNITKKETSILETSAPGPITEAAMRDLIQWYNTTLPSHPWPIAVATEFVFRFLAIHPFQDGNGRLGRALFLLTLLQSSDKSLQEVAPYLPIDRHIEKMRTDYYVTLRRCSEGKFNSDSTIYKYDNFLRFMIKVLNLSFESFEIYQRRYITLQQLSTSALTILDCFKDRPETRLQTQDIMEATQFARSTTTDILRLLTKEGFIQKLGRGASVKYQLVF